MPTDTDAPESARLRTWADSQNVRLSFGEYGPPINFADVRWALAKIQSQSAEIARMKAMPEVELHTLLAYEAGLEAGRLEVTARCEALERALGDVIADLQMRAEMNRHQNDGELVVELSNGVYQRALKALSTITEEARS